MRTRRSNRTKSYTTQKYDFDSSSSETEQHAAPPRTRRTRQPGQNDSDENFDASPVNESPNDDDMPSAGEGNSDAADSAFQTPTTPGRRVKKVKKTTTTGTGTYKGYMDVEPVTTDTHLKGYAGPFDRGMRGQALTNTWYGPGEASIQLAQRLLERWMKWTVLPPRNVVSDEGVPNIAPWADQYSERMAYMAEKWAVRVKNDDAVPGTKYRTLGADEATLYQMPKRELRLIMGPFDAQREIPMHPGDSYALSQGWIPYVTDETETKIPAGWIFDVGGIVTGMDWMPRREGEQILALAVIPHSDQEEYNYEVEHQKPDFQKYGTVQLWAFTDEEIDGVRRPSTQGPRLKKTICLDYGRARRIRWSPACDHLAVLCGDGNVHVIEVDDQDGSFGTLIYCGLSFIC